MKNHILEKLLNKAEIQVVLLQMAPGFQYSPQGGQRVAQLASAAPFGLMMLCATGESAKQVMVMPMMRCVL